MEVATHEGDRAEYRANGPDRCFHCKDELFTRITDEVVTAHRLDAVAYGENADDARRPDRPGARAAVAHRVLRPLADAGLDKAAVRAIARDLALRAWSLAMLGCSLVAVWPLLRRGTPAAVALGALIGAFLAETAMFGNAHPAVVAVLVLAARGRWMPAAIGIRVRTKERSLAIVTDRKG